MTAPVTDHYLLSRSSDDVAYLWIAALGVAAVMASLVVGVVLGLEAGELFANDATARAADRVSQGRIAAGAAWNPALMLTGASLLMVSVVAVLQRIITTIRMRGSSMAATLPGLLTPERSG